MEFVYILMENIIHWLKLLKDDHDFIELSITRQSMAQNKFPAIRSIVLKLATYTSCLSLTITDPPWLFTFVRC